MFGHLGRRAGQCAVEARAAADVAYLSRGMFAGGVVDVRDAADLIAFDRLVVADAPEWAGFFVDAIAGHLLRHEPPEDEITPEKAEWLAGQLCAGRRAASGLAESPRAVPLLLRLMEGARIVAPEVPAFALRQVLAAVITGEGPLAAGRSHFSRAVDAQDVALLRRILAAGGGGTGRPVSRAEADALFDIHAACAGGANDPAFEPLFVRAVHQHLRSASGLYAGSRAELLAPAGIAIGARTALDLLAQAGYQPDLSALVEPVPLSEEAARWLVGRLGRAADGAAARALMHLLADGASASDTSDRSASLRAVIDNAA